ALSGVAARVAASDIACSNLRELPEFKEQDVYHARLATFSDARCRNGFHTRACDRTSISYSAYETLVTVSTACNSRATREAIVTTALATVTPAALYKFPQAASLHRLKYINSDVSAAPNVHRRRCHCRDETNATQSRGTRRRRIRRARHRRGSFRRRGRA